MPSILPGDIGKPLHAFTPKVGGSVHTHGEHDKVFTVALAPATKEDVICAMVLQGHAPLFSRA
jgi:hypothetical protein